MTARQAGISQEPRPAAAASLAQALPPYGDVGDLGGSGSARTSWHSAGQEHSVMSLIRNDTYHRVRRQLVGHTTGLRLNPKIAPREHGVNRTHPQCQMP
jgi:hypothetical protein